MPTPVTGEPLTVNPAGAESATLDTVPLAAPAPIAARKLPASSADTELSALICKNEMAPGLAKVKRLEPTDVAPKFARAPAAEEEPVPPFTSASAAPLQSLPLIVLWVARAPSPRLLRAPAAVEEPVPPCAMSKMPVIVDVACVPVWFVRLR